MSSKHTPGPWAVTRVGACRAIHPAASTNERDDICRIAPHNYHPDGIGAADAEADATAALIAAAPDLLDAVRAILFQVNQGPVLERDACIAQARAAYIKATGDAQ